MCSRFMRFLALPLVGALAYLSVRVAMRSYFITCHGAHCQATPPPVATAEPPGRTALVIMARSTEEPRAAINAAMPILGSHIDVIVVLSAGETSPAVGFVPYAVPNVVQFVHVLMDGDVPAGFAPGSYQPTIPTSIGYRNMCRFFSVVWFTHPAFAAYDYLIRLDPDAYLRSTRNTDIIAYMHAHKIVLAGPQFLYDPIAFATNLDTLVINPFVETHPPASPLHPRFFPDGHTYSRLVLNTAIAFFDARFFRSSVVQAFLRQVEATGQQMFYRWGDHIIVTLAAALIAEPRQFRYLPEVAFVHKAEESYYHRASDRVCAPDEGVECFFRDPPVEPSTYLEPDFSIYLRALPRVAKCMRTWRPKDEPVCPCFVNTAGSALRFREAALGMSDE